MTQYAIADIGSNTMVLVIYEFQGTKPVQVYHVSTPAHLIDYVDETTTMSQEGIQKAYEVLKEYEAILNEKQIQYRWADITEPCRITNQKELVDCLSKTSFEVHALSGYEEAACDYIGTKHSYPDFKDGIAFDVGGGSTELISFQNGEIIDAMSFHLGCVRLSHLPLDTPQCLKELKKAQEDFPSLKTTNEELIGIGGTMRAIGLVCDALYGTKNTLPVTDLMDMYEKLQANDPSTIEAMHTQVRESRWPVFLPGTHMIIEICKLFEAKTIFISESGIREGFLETCLNRQKG